MLYVFNKIDKADNVDELKIQAQEFQPHVFVSAKKKENLKPLIAYLKEWDPRPQSAQ